MSRCYVMNDRGEVLRDRSRPKKHTPAWGAAREARRSRRRGMEQKARNENGFLVIDEGGHQRLRDPGTVDRALYISNKPQKDRDNREARVRA